MGQSSTHSVSTLLVLSIVVVSAVQASRAAQEATDKNKTEQPDSEARDSSKASRTTSKSNAIAPAGAQKAPIALRHNGPFLFRRSENSAIAEVPVQILDASVPPQELRFVVDNASHENLADSSLAQSMTVSWLPASDILPPRLQIRLQLQWLDRQRLYGAYAAQISVIRQDNEVALLTVPFHFPKSVLAAPSPIYLESMCWMGIQLQGSPPPPLVLRLTQGPAPGNLKVTQSDNAKIDLRTVPGRLSVAAPSQLSLNEPTLSPVTVESPFPLGDAKGSLSITSPDIETMNVDFTVRTRQHWSVIIALTLVGLIIGFVTRIGLTGFIGSRTLRIRMQGILDRIAAHKNKKDARFQASTESLKAQITEQLRHLAILPSKAELEAITEKINQFQQQFDSALTEFERSRTSLETPVLTISGVLDAAWELPPVLEKVRRESRNDFNDIKSLLLNENLTEAKSKLDHQNRELPETLWKGYRPWREAMIREIQRIREIEKVPAALQQALDDQWKSVQDALPSERPDPTEAASVRIEKLLKFGSRGRQIGIDFTDKFVDHISETIVKVIETLKRVSNDLPKPEVIENLERLRQQLDALSVQDLLDALPGTDSNNPALRDLREKLQRALESIRNSVLNQATDEALRSQLKSDLDLGKYAEAAATLVNSFAEPRTRSTRGSSQSEDDQRHDMVKEVQVRPLSGSSLPSIAGAVSVQRLVSVSSGMAVDIPQSLRDIFCAQLLQWVLLALIIACIAVTTFIDGFVGTVKECITIGLWAFSLDLGLNTVIDKAKGLSPSR